MRLLYKKAGRQKGAALLALLALSAMIIPLIQGAWLDSQIEYQFKRYRINELQARHNAKSGAGLSLLRVYIFKGIEKSLSGKWESIARPLLDRIWAFPFVWPLSPLETMLKSEKQDLEKLNKQSFFKGAYVSSLSVEDGLLDLNDLSSPLDTLMRITFTTLFNLLSRAVEQSPELKEKYGAEKLSEILGNLSDWASPYGGFREEPLEEEGKEPLKRSFASIEEIKKVPGISPKIFEILKPHTTVYGTKGLNINYASKEILLALNIPENLADQILYRTQISSSGHKPFLNSKDFCSFMEDLDSFFCEELKREYKTLNILSFSYPMAFRVRSLGEYRGRTAQREALLFDLSSVALNYQKLRFFEELVKKDPQANSLLPPQEEKAEGKKVPPKKIDYSYYKSLIIMLSKEDY